MRVLKFGGTSVATVESIGHVLEIVAQAVAERAAGEQPSIGPRSGVLVVVSAMGGVTNDLVAAIDRAAERDEGYADIWSRLLERHLQAAQQLAGDEVAELQASLRQRFDDLRDLLHGVFLLREASLRTRDGILTYGERLSADLVAAALRHHGQAAQAVDARRMIVTDGQFGRAQVDFETSYERIRRELSHVEGVPVVTGFTGATAEGHTTSLGRGGSDYTAALLGAAVEAAAVELWTDVDGVMSADPRWVEGAFPQRQMSYSELMELSHFGAKVVYPPTIHPARSHGIPLLIKNTFDPDAPGTRVVDDGATNPHPIRGIASIQHVALLRLEGDGMVGVPGIAARLFSALALHQVSVILISQSSSEHSICFAVAPDDAAAAQRAVAKEFALEHRLGIIDPLVMEGEQSVVAAVGEEMRRQPGIAGRLFSVLGRHGVNVKAISQGSSELNISLVVDRPQEKKAVTSIHRAFFTPRRRRLALAVMGPGRVGTELLAQVKAAAPVLAAQEDLEVAVVALANSRRMLLDRQGIDLDTWSQQLAEAPDLDTATWLDALAPQGDDLTVVADCTASDAVGDLYLPLLNKGCGVVGANKRPFAGPYDRFAELWQTSRRGQGALFLEATVGAGLPVLGPLEDLRRTGDRILAIDGILSGTVNAVLESLSQGMTFSQAVRAAHDQGLTEPHPWDDLSGGDVARKLCILSRLSGQPVEMSDLRVAPVMAGDDWGSMDADTFWQQLPRVDADFDALVRRAEADGRRLRYVARASPQQASVGIVPVAADHPSYSLAGPDNLVAFTTDRYRTTPLVVRGPGAGTQVTAAGVFADALRAAARLRT